MTAPTPARPGTADELREEIARAICDSELDEGAWEDWILEEEYERFTTNADAVLALPAVRGLLADRDTLARVAALAEEWAACPFVDYVSRDELAREHADRLREILRGAS